MKNFALALIFGLVAQSAMSDTSALSKAVQGQHRSDANSLRDQHRNPIKTLSFFDIEPHHTVVEIWPSGGWYTEILAPYLKDKGKLIAAHFDLNDKQASYRMRSRKNFDSKMQSDTVYNQVDIQSLMFDEANGVLTKGISPKNSVDRVVTFRAMHGIYSRGITEAAMQHFYDILKPGGKLGLVQHEADPDQNWQANNIGYVGKQYIIDAAQKAGFVLEAQAYFNKNPLDHKRHKGGVWRLSPSLKGHTEEEKKRYQQIGESDRMTLLFTKPSKTNN